MTKHAVIAVIGGGLMGHGIAQVFASAGHSVRVYDAVAASLDSLHERIRRNLVELGRDPSAVDRVSAHAKLADAARDVDVVFEAGPENLALKQKLFGELEAAVPAHAILASNTSVIPITQIMSGLKTGVRALGTHWWNPPFLVPLVEVIKTASTSVASVDTMMELLTSVGKTPVIVEKDVPGFVGNRLQHALWREAISLVQNGVCDAKTVDTVVKASFGRRLAVLGPMENMDLVGTELTLAIHENVLPHVDRTPGALPLLKELISEGKLGMKTGEGFQKWTPEQQAIVRARLFAHLQLLEAQGI